MLASNPNPNPGAVGKRIWDICEMRWSQCEGGCLGWVASSSQGLSNPTPSNFPFCCGLARYDYVEVEDLTEKTVVGRWCGSQSAPAAQTSKGNQLRIHFVSDEYFPSEPGFCVRYSLLPLVCTSSTVTRSLARRNTHTSCFLKIMFVYDRLERAQSKVKKKLTINQKISMLALC